MKRLEDRTDEAMGQTADERNSAGAPPANAARNKIEAKIDRDLEDSFPASNPPGWTLGVERSFL